MSLNEIEKELHRAAGLLDTISIAVRRQGLDDLDMSIDEVRSIIQDIIYPEEN